ncbi:MAG: aspartate/glutamate racemase family protein [Tannerellaceae bacterium]|nr:aspartate/glutamate racemase family protein [Tannerellaceae bacterium]
MIGKHLFQKIIRSLRLLLLVMTPSSLVWGETLPAKKVKVALIYTITTPELKEDVVREIRKELGDQVEILSYEDPSVFKESEVHGYVTARAAAKLIGMYMKAVEEGAEVILSICSTVADATCAMRDAAAYIGVPMIMINEEMCREAVRTGNRIAVMATFPTALAPTKNILQRVAREMGKQIEIIEVLVENGFGLEQESFKKLMAEKAGEIVNQADVILFAQGSMAYCEEYIAGLYHKVVLSNPRFGAKAVKSALMEKGLVR